MTFFFINITYYLKKICGRLDGTQCELLFTSKIYKIQINIWRFYCNQMRYPKRDLEYPDLLFEFYDYESTHLK